jgi:hypothetical protein
MKKCRVCETTEKIIRHHIQYKKYGAKKDKIIPLCQNCHNLFHKFIKGNDPYLKILTQEYIKGNLKIKGGVVS